jgi:hypothetical protein
MPNLNPWPIGVEFMVRKDEHVCRVEGYFKPLKNRESLMEHLKIHPNYRPKRFSRGRPEAARFEGNGGIQPGNANAQTRLVINNAAPPVVLPDAQQPHQPSQVEEGEGVPNGESLYKQKGSILHY